MYVLLLYGTIKRISPRRDHQKILICLDQMLFMLYTEQCIYGFRITPQASRRSKGVYRASNTLALAVQNMGIS